MFESAYFEFKTAYHQKFPETGFKKKKKQLFLQNNQYPEKLLLFENLAK